MNVTEITVWWLPGRRGESAWRCVALSFAAPLALALILGACAPAAAPPPTPTAASAPVVVTRSLPQATATPAPHPPASSTPLPRPPTSTPLPIVSPTPVGATATAPTTVPPAPTRALASPAQVASTSTVPLSPSPLPRPSAADPRPAASPTPRAMVQVPIEVPARFAAQVRFGQQQRLTVPAGFRVGIFAAGLGQSRFMAYSDKGILFLSVPRTGQVLALPDRDGDGVADTVLTVADGLNLPHGLAFAADGSLYVAETNRVVRLSLDPETQRATRQETIVPSLPAGAGHWTRTIGFGPDGKLYVSIGSSCNACIEREPFRAAIVQYNPDGSGGRLFAQGLRNSVGFVWHPRTGEIWATDNGRDLLGDDLPAEEVNIVRDGKHYGWPRCNGDRVDDLQYGQPGFCAGTEPPVVQMQAHSAPLGLAFYTGTRFPPEYHGDLFVAFHGSWNRSEKTGYKLVRIPMRSETARGGKPGVAEDFVAGWLRPDQSVWGRPVQPIVAPDGSVLLSDDSTGIVYRIWYAG
ncbi:MAG: PQQ-dependent sugar dehydrogenase [Chloroflexi bacterium]|nr:PQQ-dependent sugar dehydrogenase [Chloroflexota bacterium]